MRWFTNVFKSLNLIVCWTLFVPSSYGEAPTDRLLSRLLKKHPDRFAEIQKEEDKYAIQIIYTKIDRNNKGYPNFTTYRYGVNRYFYPGGSIKLPAAALALEKLNALQLPGLDKNTCMETLAEYPWQTEVYQDTTSEDGRPSVGHYIKRALLADDDEAYDRLYEFLGQAYFNTTMRAKGYSNFQATERLGAVVEPEKNRYTNPVRFVQASRRVFDQPGAYSTISHPLATPNSLDRKNTKEGVPTAIPTDFYTRNAFALEDQHTFLKNLIFPERCPESQKLALTEDDYQFLYRYMSQLPIETRYPRHYNDSLDDASFKFLLFGKTKRRTPRQIRSFNKTGEAYGYLIDNAYITDFEMGVEFILSAVISYTNDQVLRENRQDDKGVGYQFMADLGKTILEYELQRKRRIRPDLSRFEVEYDK